MAECVDINVIPTVETTVLDSSEPISPADTHTHTHDHTPPVRFAGIGCYSEIHTCVSSAGGPLRGHAVPLQVCVRHGQQVVVANAAADSWLGVEEPARVVSWDGDSNVIVGRRETLLDTQEQINIKRWQKEPSGLDGVCVSLHRFSVC